MERSAGHDANGIPAATRPRRWKPSRFNLIARDPSDALLIFNTFSGAFLQFRNEFADHVDALLRGAAAGDMTADPAATLVSSGILVPAEADELRRAKAVYDGFEQRTDRLALIIMPTEKCNFRCTYCYEDFVRGRMSAANQRAVLRLIEREASRLRTLKISWFGGEPLAAIGVIEALSEGMIAECRRHDIAFGAGITTNGYLLDADKLARCLAAGIQHFQVTLDGPASTHDTLRVLASGGPTFDTILANLRGLHATNERFTVSLRVNYTPSVAAELPEFLRFLGEEFGDDPRFAVNCHAVGHWGGPHDEKVETCDAQSEDDVRVAFMRNATQAGFDLDFWKTSMQWHGSACYAADPRSFVIGSDCSLYKCTVALSDPRNQIGRLREDGTLDIARELHDLWVHSGEEQDTGCQKCAFRPACHGDYCPWERIENGAKTCPPIKVHPDRYLPIIAVASRRGGSA